MKKLRIALLVALAVTLVAIFLPWLSINLFIINVAISGWSLHWFVKVFALLILVSGALVFLKNRTALIMPLVVSILGILALIYLLAVPIKVPGAASTATASMTQIIPFLGIGFYLFVLGLLATLGLSIAVMKSR